MLKNDGLVELDYKLELASLPFNKLKISYKGKDVIFDLADDSLIEDELLDSSDFYVKRMLLKTDYEHLDKLIPFGLNYSVMIPNPFLSKLWMHNPGLLAYSAKYNFPLSRLMGINDSISNVHIDNMESDPKRKGEIIFGTRLWDPQKNEIDWKKDERKKLNIQRMSIIRQLKLNHGDLFVGGVERSELSEILCPDLLVSKAESKKKNYLESLKSAIIGISNFGLEGSIGWKFAEYIAHGMAVVSTPIEEFVLHGALEEGKNFLRFEMVEDCLEAVNTLLANEKLRWDIQQENVKYYHEYLHPKAKMKEILRLIEG